MKWIVVLTGFVFMVSSCSKPKSPDYLGYENFKVDKVGVNNTVLSTRVKLYNPNAYALKLKSASIDVFVNNSFLGHSSVDSLIILPGKDTSYVPLQLTASAKDIISNTLKVWLNPEVKVKITGTARAGRGSIFVNIPINYEGVQRIQL
jgi:LEA14-like dessication related protein